MTHTIYDLVIDVPHYSATIGTYNTKEEADSAGQNWKMECDADLTAEELRYQEEGGDDFHTYEVVEVECDGCEECCTEECDGCPYCYEDESPTAMGWVGKDGRP